MKKYSKYLIVAMCVIAVAFSAGSFIRVNAACSSTSASAPGQPVDLTYAAEKSLPSVVHILNTRNSKVQTVEVESDPFSDFFSDPFGFFGNPQGGGTQKRQIRTPKSQGSGSGVIISSDGYIVTNNHVVEGADELTVTLNDNKEYSARIIGTDKSTDLALIKIEGSGFPAITIANSDDIKVGEWVLAVGNPFNLTNTVTAGIVSAKSRSLYVNTKGVESFIQTDAAINRGNSGGALVNTRGELIGINAMLYSETGSYSGYGFAIPTSIMNKVVDDLKKYGTVQRAVIGISGTDVKRYIDAQKEEGNELELGTMEGIYVDSVTDGSAAAEMGLKHGDVITAIDGKQVKKMAELQEVLATKRPGDKVKVKVFRDKKDQEFTITLKNAQGNTKVVKKADMELLGAAFREVPAELKRQLNLGYGVQVTGVSDGRMADSGIRKGFIILKANGKQLRTVQDLEDVMKAASQSPDQVLFMTGVYPSGKRANYAVDLAQN